MVERIAADRSCRFLSLDVFDTLLFRRVPEPVDLFVVLGQRLRELGLLATWLTNEAFAELRRRAEEAARESRGHLGPEVSLEEIWDAIPTDLFVTSDRQRLVEIEVDVERDLTVLDPQVAHLVGTVRRSGARLVLVSDTYFSDTQLRRLLSRPGFDLPADVVVFRSQEYGTSKGVELWPAVLNALGCAGEEIVHLGDNEVADDEVPTLYGIRTVHYKRVIEGFEEVLDRESRSLELLDPHEGDLGLTTLRARVTGACASGTGRLDDARRFGAGVLGPVLTGFAEWVARTAADRGVRTVWCPMREGELLAELVNGAARARGLDVEARPIWLSRHVTWLAAVDQFDAESVRKMIRRSYGITVRALLNALGVRVGDVPALAVHLDRVLDGSEVTHSVAAALVESPHLRHKLATSITRKRERLVTALRKAGALEQDELVMIDLGWGATIQLHLAESLALAQIDVRPSGMYLATDERSTRLLSRGLRVEGFLGAAGQPRSVVRTLARSPEVLELSVNALCGSLVDFTDGGDPVLGPVAGGAPQDAERRAVQDGVRSFQARWNDHVMGDDRPWPFLDGPTVRARLAEIIRSALAAPTSAEASLFAAWAHEDNLGSELVSRLVPSDLERLLPYMSPNDMPDLAMRDAFWPALVAAADPQLAAADRALSLGGVDPSVFEPSEPSRSRMMVHTLDDEWSPGPEQDVRINHNGLSFCRLGLDAAEVTEAADVESRIQEVSLELAGRAAIVRVDWIEARVRTVGGRDVVLDWETPADLAGLHLADGTWLGGNLVEFRGPRSAVVLPVMTRTGEPVASVRLTVAFAMLPQSRSGLGVPARPASTRARLAGRLFEEYRTRGVRGVASGATRTILRRMVE